MPATTAAPIITPTATSRGKIRTWIGRLWAKPPRRPIVPQHVADCGHVVAEDQAHHCGCGDTTCGEPRCIDDHLSVCVEGAALELFYARH